MLPSKFQGTAITPEDSLYLAMTGRGGYGDPPGRDPARVREDVVEDYITLETARRVYGVVIDPATCEVNTAATAELRANIK